MSASRWLVVLALVAGAGCGTTTGGPDDGPGPVDGSVDVAMVDLRPGPDLLDLAPGGCSADKDCDPGQRCDPAAHRCVACLADRDCPDGRRCRQQQCVSGCTAQHGCGDAGVCELDAGACVECRGDGDCRDPGARHCDLSRSRCQPCLPASDDCPVASYCAASANGYACTPGCRRDLDCAGGGKASRCDLPSHRCLECLADADCGPGLLCVQGACAPGCHQAHGCAGKLACCAMACVDTGSDGNNCGGCGLACAQGTTCCSAACTHLDSDVGNCGACGHACMGPPHTVGACQRAACAYACAPGFADCNADPADGCEVDIESDVKSCGACGQACAPAHASPACVAGHCGIARCDPGFRDCNGQVQDGCEADTSSDPNNCGACGQVCGRLPHAAGMCHLGACAVAACDPGWGDCNGKAVDGCEAPLDSDPANCGGCKLACPAPPHVVATCAARVCGVGGCQDRFADCNGNPRDGCEASLDTDPANCGACFVVCPVAPHAAGACNLGHCGLACDAGYGDCDGDPKNGCEHDLRSDAFNCGACGKACAKGEQCVDSACVSQNDLGFGGDLGVPSDL